MRPYARTANAALLVSVLTAAGVTLVAPSALAADTAPPVLSSISRTSSADVTPGAELAFSYATSGETSPLRSIYVGYRDPAGRTALVDLGRDLATSGAAVGSLSDGVANDSLQASVIYMTDAAGNLARYYRDGKLCTRTVCASTHSLSFGELDVAVSGSTPDTAPPALTSLTLETPAVMPGGLARITYSSTDAHPLMTTPVIGAHASFQDSRNNDFELSATEIMNGSISLRLPTDQPQGVYRLTALRLADAIGNSAYYLPNGMVSGHPANMSNPSSHTIPMDVAITVGSASPSTDVTPPHLTEVSYADPYVTSGGVGRVAFAGTDDTAITRIEIVHWRTPQGPGTGPYPWTLAANVTGPGTASGQLPYVASGDWPAAYVVAYDAAGNWSRYQNNGSRDCSRLCPTTHSLSLADLVAEVLPLPTAPSDVTVAPRDRSAQVAWLSAESPQEAPLTGYTITVSPGGKVYSVAANSRAFTVTGLTNDTKYTFVVRAKNASGTGPGRSSSAIPRQRHGLTGGDDATGDLKADLFAVARSGSAYLYRGTGSGSLVGSGIRLGSAGTGIRTLLYAQNVPVYYGTDVWAVTYDGKLVAHHTDSNLQYFSHRVPSVSGLGAYRHIAAPGDVTGNGLADLYLVNDAGDLYLRAQGSSGFGSPRRIGGGWNVMTSVVGVGDLDGDRRNDLVARKKDGTLWLYAGNGTGGFRYKKQIGTSTSWKSFATLAGVGDFSGDKRNDLLALAPNGYLYVYKGNGKGGFSGKALISKGFSSFV